MGPSVKNAFLWLAIVLFLMSSTAPGRVPSEGGTISRLGVVAYENGNAESHPADAPDASPLSSSVSLSISSQGTIAYPSTIGGWLHTDGRWIRDQYGNTVRLGGVLCYIRLQNERAKFEAAKAAGARYIVLCLWKCDIENPTPEPGVDRTGLPAIDRAVSWCRELGLKVILYQFEWGPYGSLPGESQGCWPVPIEFWTDAGLQQEWLDMWRLLVDRYKNDSTVVGIDLMNEPYMTKQYGTPPANAQSIWEGIAENAVADLKGRNPNLLFIVEGWPSWSDIGFLKQPNIVFSDHIYYDDAKSWNDWAKAYAAGDLAKGKQLLASLIDDQWMSLANQGIALWIGGTGFVTSDPHWREQMEDELGLLDERSLGYSIYTFAASPWNSPYDIVDQSVTGYQLTDVGQIVSTHLHSLP